MARFVAAALLALNCATAAQAVELFEPSGGPPEPRPLFGERVESLYQDARKLIFEPAKNMAAELIANPSARAAIDRAAASVSHLAEKVDAEIARPAASAIEKFLSRPEVDAWVAMAEASARRFRDTSRQWIVEPWTRSVEELVTPASGRARVGAERTMRLPRPTLAAQEPRAFNAVGTKDFDDNDPLEPVNRVMFSFNHWLQNVLMEPVSDLYIETTTPPMRNGVRNFFANLREPLTAVSGLLEGKLDDAGNATARFGINTVFGLGGVLDPASQMGFPFAPRDFEQTLCSFRLNPGPFVVLPVLGPATMRDAVGRIAAVLAYYQVMGVAMYVPYRVTDVTLQYVDLRDRLDFVNSISFDPYVAQKVLYLSTRTMDCGNQAAVDKEFFTR